MEALAIQINCHKYKNLDSPEKLIRYITRTRGNEDKADDLLLWGHPAGYTYPKTVEDIIYEIKYVQKGYKTHGSLMCHYVIRLRADTFDKMNGSIYTLGNYAVECCNHLFNLGHQSCFAIHQSSDQGLHIHLAINSVNFRNGHKLRQYPKEIRPVVEIPLLQCLEKYIVSVESFPEFY